MFGFRLKSRENVRTFMPNQALGYTFVDEDGEKFPTVKVDGYYFPVDNDNNIRDGYDLKTGERVYVYDTYTNQRTEVLKDFLTLTYRYVLEHKMPKGITIEKFIVADAM